MTKLDFATELDFSEILTNPILDIAARFWENERYDAFRVCYRSMRIIDDLVDNSKTGGGLLLPAEREECRKVITNWINSLLSQQPVDSFQSELLGVINKFSIPVTLWKKLAEAMFYDLNHDGFASFPAFLRYTEGAAIAPASIFVHLCGVKKQSNTFSIPPYDIRWAARSLAIFSYLVHIVRDFQKDQKQGLQYFADDLIEGKGLHRDQLAEIANGGVIPNEFRSLIAQYISFMEYYRNKARRTNDQLAQYLDLRYQLSMEIIYNLYLQIFERINAEDGSFTTTELNPSPEEVEKCIKNTISSFKQRS